MRMEIDRQLEKLNTEALTAVRDLLVSLASVPSNCHDRPTALVAIHANLPRLAERKDVA